MMKIEHEIMLQLVLENKGVKVTLSKDELRALNWPEVLWHISLHRIDYLLYGKRINNLSWYDINKVIARDIKSKYLVNNYRNLFIYNNILPELIKVLDGMNLDYTFTKGIVSALTLYDNVGDRYFGDIDILINKRDLKKFKQALVSAGYICGRCSYDKGNIIEATPESIKFFEMTTHQTHPFNKLINDPICRSIEIDFNFGLGPDKNLKSGRLISKLLKNKMYIKHGNYTIASLSKEGLFIHCCLHIFRDSTALFHVKNCDDMKLYQYLELYKIVTYWRLEMNWDYIKELTLEFGVEKQVYYALYNCGFIFSNIYDIVNPFLKSIEPEEKEYLDEYGVENKDKGKWNIPFIERLFDMNRSKLVKDVIEGGEFEAFRNRERFIDKNFKKD